MKKSKVISWNKSAGGLFYPQELEAMRGLNLSDKIELHGLFSICCWHESEPERKWLLDLGGGEQVKENLIVNLGRGALATLSRTTAAGMLPTSAIGVYDLGYLAVGRGSNSGVLLPDPSSVGLYSESTGATSPPGQIVRPLMTVTTPPPGPPFMVNLWTAQIGSAQLNSAPYNTINEVAIFCLNNSTMFCFRTFANQTKSVGFVFECRYSHVF